jgi:hypothetical protein
MPRSSKPVEIDARWVYWRSFLLFFLFAQVIVWHRVSQLPVLMPGHRLILFLVAPWATPQSFALALLAAGLLTLGAIMIVRWIIRPLWEVWLNPPVDPACGLFHLGASESIIASVPARRQSGWRWPAGSLALTNHRLWFFPAAWDGEPWSLELGETDRIERAGSFAARSGPIRNWPVPFHVRGRSGQDAAFVVPDPAVVLEWFQPRAGAVSTGSVRSRESSHTGAIDG